MRPNTIEVNQRTMDDIMKAWGPDADLEALDADSLRAEVRRLREGLRYIVSQTGDDLCWRDFYEAAAKLLPEAPDLKNLQTVLPRDKMLRNCERFVDCLLAGKQDQYRTEPRPTWVPIASLRAATEAEQTGVYYVAGLRSITCTSRVPVRHPQLHLVAADNDHYEYVVVNGPDLKSLLDLLYADAAVEVRAEQRCQSVYDYPTGPWIATWEDVEVACQDCGSRFPRSQLCSDDDDDHYTDRQCPNCSAWDCCRLQLETIPQYQARQPVTHEPTILATLRDCGTDPLSVS